MEISSTSTFTALSFASVATEASFPTAASAQPKFPRDRVALSPEALDSFRIMKSAAGTMAGTTLDLLSEALSSLSGREVEELERVAQGEGTDAAQPGGKASYREGSLSTDSVSLSVAGTIATKDGKDVGFSLDLSYDHASIAAGTARFQSGPGALSLGFSGAAAELTSTSFSFTLSSAGEDSPIAGKGAFRLNDEVSRIVKDAKPLVKEFLAATGESGGWGQVNRFLRSAI